MDWIPTISDRHGPLYARIVAALTDDIGSGRLRRGQQLPTHRALARALGIDLTTVTRAYSDARERGLTEARVGQGTFVAAHPGGERPTKLPFIDVDLSMNLPPHHAPAADLEGRIARGLAALATETGFSAHLSYREPGGSEEERAAVAAWLRTRLPQASPERVVIAAGTQTAILAFLLAHTERGDVVLTESLTYPGLRVAAAQIGVQPVGVAMDEFGIVPEALAAACRRHTPKALYLVPTIQNPTTGTLPPDRRAAIAEIVRAHNLLLFEDDAYGALAPDVVPLAALAPERTIYAMTLSKSMAPGLRVSFVLAPDRGEAIRLRQALRAAIQMPVALTVALVVRWLRDGSAEAIISAIRDEAAARQKIAAHALAGHSFAAHPNGHHIWVPLPGGWSRAEFAAHVQRRGLAVVTSDAFAVGEDPPPAIRVALGAATSRAELAGALDVLATALHMSAPLRVV